MADDVAVRVVPRAKRNELNGERDGRLVIRVAAPPVDGKANAAVCKLLAKALRVPRSHVTVVRGGASRDKLVRVEGAEPGALDRLRSRAQPSE